MLTRVITEWSGRVCDLQLHSISLPVNAVSGDGTTVNGIPSDPDYRLEYTPSPTTLFRFSALTFNAHAIHLDREYAKGEGYPGGFIAKRPPRTALTYPCKSDWCMGH